MMTDPIADMLTRLRNAQRNRCPSVEMPSSQVKVNIAEILKREGYVAGYDVESLGGPMARLRIHLRYGAEGERVLTQLKRESKPGRRLYVSLDEIPKVLGGLGICILSTSRGILSDREARKERVGGELLCTVW